mgnify:CR=1 FL=1
MYLGEGAHFLCKLMKAGEITDILRMSIVLVISPLEGVVLRIPFSGEAVLVVPFAEVLAFGYRDNCFVMKWGDRTFSRDAQGGGSHSGDANDLDFEEFEKINSRAGLHLGYFYTTETAKIVQCVEQVLEDTIAAKLGATNMADVDKAIADAIAEKERDGSVYTKEDILESMDSRMRRSDEMDSSRRTSTTTSNRGRHSCSSKIVATASHSSPSFPIYKDGNDEESNTKESSNRPLPASASEDNLREATELPYGTPPPPASRPHRSTSQDKAKRREKRKKKTMKNNSKGKEPLNGAKD